MSFLSKEAKITMPAKADALTGRDTAMDVSDEHFVLKTALKPPFLEPLQKIVFGMGCFWGAERHFWQQKGVLTTAVGYAAGHTANPSYDEVCSGQTGHNEVVLVVFDPSILDLAQLLVLFWEAHDPTQGMRQGGDAGTQYRSGIYFDNENQRIAAEDSKLRYEAELLANGYAKISTEILPLAEFYYAESYHQQYLAKNPGGYCGLGGTGICLPQ